MTAQIGDHYTYDGNEYTVVTMSESIPFHPADYGIFPGYVCTACARGYWCHYTIKDDSIFLKDLYVNSAEDYYPAINGVLPNRVTEYEYEDYMGHRRYAGINLKIPYTGKILIGDGFLDEYYVHMGFQSFWAYKKLIELVFENGKLIESNDQSRIAAAVRMIIRTEGKLPRGYGADIWWL